MSDSNSMPQKLWKWLSGFGLATTLLVVLGILTWLATLEQVEHGLLATLDKYFHWRSWWVLAELWVFPQYFDRPLRIPLPGGYWVCALLLVNMICGGLIRARKGWKTVGVLISHFGIIFMIAAGGVAQLFEERGVMMLVEGDQADYAISLTEPTIEVLEIVDGKVSGDVSVAREKQLGGMAPRDTRLVKFPAKPFDLEITGWLTNAVVRPGGEGSRNPTVDGWTLEQRENEKAGELNGAACYARAVFADGAKGEHFILAVPNGRSGVRDYPPVMIEAEGKKFAVRMVKQTLPVPFQVKLKDAVSVYYPNSSRPKSFHSDIERIEGEDEPVSLRIEMNEPMRAGGYTFFQRTMGGGPQIQQGPEFSGFEVVSNPADKWPEYSLYVVTVGLLIHFLMKFAAHLGASNRSKTKS
ncbi:cytochrome c biogenesis protein ResB [Haloferula sp.]|uniref:cytochrome c biogenesis protein ResB n=1 Tax=Haloferula sp. TaxID=2497595 RepID=UPI00329E7891